jgi:exopolyphosphatase/pppGpp-phosphohydrolase
MGVSYSDNRRRRQEKRAGKASDHEVRRNFGCDRLHRARGKTRQLSCQHRFQHPDQKYPEKRAHLAAIAAYLHDIGNVINRDYHAQTAAILAHSILSGMNMPMEDILEIMAAIGNHDERDGQPVSDICAATILADKSDVHSSRVRTLEMIKQDIHDRVNYAAKSSFLRVDEEKKLVTLEIKIDTSISQVMEYFEIFLSRMVVCRRAAEFLGLKFQLEINGQRLL